MNKEDHSYCKDNAIPLLAELGFLPLSPEILAPAGATGDPAPLLKDILEQQVRAINRFEYNGELHSFSDDNIHSLITQLEEITRQDTPGNRKRLFDLLLLGKSFEETLPFGGRSFTMQLIDWEDVRQNQFHLGIDVPAGDKADDRPIDLVLYVNGIPFVIIGCDHAQFARETIRSGAFRYAQLLILVKPEGSRYAAAGDSSWMPWKEDHKDDPAFWSLMETLNKLPDNLDHLLYALCRPQRLLEFVGKFILWGDGDKRAARCHQYFAVRRTMEKVTAQRTTARREGGVLWHVQGSGRVFTMLLLARDILGSNAITRARVIILTDRTALDRQIAATFNHFGQPNLRPDSGTQLFGALRDNTIPVIITVFQKIAAATKLGAYTDESTETFIFIDEMRGMHAGKFYADLNKMFPNACYIKFVQLPFSSGESTSYPALPQLIHSYTLKDAIDDGIILPVLYENKKSPLSDTGSALAKSALDIVALDISTHYNKSWKGTGLKGMVIAPDKLTAFRLQQCFDTQDAGGVKINAVTLVSGDRFPGYFEEGDQDPLIAYQTRLKAAFGSDDNYESAILNEYGSDTEKIELLIVVDKFITGFDLPRLTVIYLIRPMAPVSLLQVIARTSRLFPGKAFGMIIDYSGSLDNQEQLKQLAPISPAVGHMLRLQDYYQKVDRIAASTALLSIQQQQARFREALSEFEQTFRITVASEHVRHLYVSYQLDFFRKKLAAYHHLVQRMQEEQTASPFQPGKGGEWTPFEHFIRELFSEKEIDLPAGVITQFGNSVRAFIEQQLVRDWKTSLAAQKKMFNGIEDLLIAFKEEYHLPLGFDDIDRLINSFMDHAKLKY